MHAAIKKSICLVAACIFAFGISEIDVPWQVSHKLESWFGEYQYLVVAEVSPEELLKPVDATVLGNAGNMHVVCNADNKVKVLEKVKFPKNSALDSFNREHLVYCVISTNAKRLQSYSDSTDVEEALVSARIILKPDNENKSKKILAYSRIYAVWGQERLFRLLAQLAFIVIFCVIYQKIIGWKADFSIANQVAKRQPYIVMYAVLFKGIYGLVVGVVTGFMFINSPVTENIFGSVFYAPITEEILYRCLLFTLVLRYSNAWFATFFVSALFAVAHGYEQISITVWLFLFALVMQYIYYRYKTITLCIISHAIGNAAVTLANYYKHDAF